MVVGGTSASTACLVGMINLAGSNYTTTTALLENVYSLLHSSHLRDITSGNNGYPCLVGWDYVTGVGTPLGLAAL